MIPEQAVRELEESRARWRALVQSVPDQIFEIDRDGIIRFVNRVVSPYGVTDVVGTHWLRYVPPDQCARLQAAFENALATAKPESFEVMAEGADGTVAWYSSHLGPIVEAGVVTGVVLVARDITPRKEAEAQLFAADRMLALGTLAAGVAHEINNPLAALIANVDLARIALGSRAEEAKERMSTSLAEAEDAAHRIRRIVRDLRLLSRPDDEAPGPVDLRDVIESSIRMAWAEIRHRANLVRDFGKLPSVIATSARLGQVFLNLLINAAQAIDEGRAVEQTITIRGTFDAETVQIDIEDTGSGIAESVLGRLFTPFFSTKPIGIGTGLGLSISRTIVAGFGGEIRVKSEQGHGSTFTVVLRRALEQTSIQAPVPRPPPRPASRRGTVLVIDDDVSVALALKRILERSHEVIAVTRGADGLAKIVSGGCYDVVFCDLMMPDMSGMDVHDELMQTRPDIAEQMVFVTGGAFTQRARDFMARVSNLRLEKPFESARILAIVNERVDAVA